MKKELRDRSLKELCPPGFWVVFSFLLCLLLILINSVIVEMPLWKIVLITVLVDFSLCVGVAVTLVLYEKVDEKGKDVFPLKNISKTNKKQKEDELNSLKFSYEKALREKEELKAENSKLIEENDALKNKNRKLKKVIIKKAKIK